MVAHTRNMWCVGSVLGQVRSLCRIPAAAAAAAHRQRDRESCRTRTHARGEQTNNSTHTACREKPAAEHPNLLLPSLARKPAALPRTSVSVMRLCVCGIALVSSECVRFLSVRRPADRKNIQPEQTNQNPHFTHTRARKRRPPPPGMWGRTDDACEEEEGDAHCYEQEIAGEKQTNERTKRGASCTI
jgi:hypothetical protein